MHMRKKAKVLQYFSMNIVPLVAILVIAQEPKLVGLKHAFRMRIYACMVQYWGGQEIAREIEVNYHSFKFNLTMF